MLILAESDLLCICKPGICLLTSWYLLVITLNTLNHTVVQVNNFRQVNAVELRLCFERTQLNHSLAVLVLQSLYSRP